MNLALGDASVYDGKCVCARVRAGDNKLRLKAPRAGVFRGSKRSLRWADTEMQPVLVRGAATVHLAGVIDDHLMRISHVLRGRD